MREDNYKVVDGYMSDSGRRKQINNRNHPTYQDITTFRNTFQVQSSTTYEMNQRKPNQKQRVKRQSEFINSDKAGFKLFRGFIGQHNHRGQGDAN